MLGSQYNIVYEGWRLLTSLIIYAFTLAAYIGDVVPVNAQVQKEERTVSVAHHYLTKNNMNPL